MSIIRTEIEILAGAELCFDLARSVDAHVASAGSTRETAVGGVTSGLLGLGDTVTWRATHFGITQELTGKITAFDRPRHFRDEMTRGAFKRLAHDHYFEPLPHGTRMVDVFDFAAPWGILGPAVDRILLTRYLQAFLEHRAVVLKRLAESGEGLRLIANS